MLTPVELEKLRNAARRHWPRGDRSVPAPFAGGPLDGLMIRVGLSELDAYATGFATLTRTGVVQALYTLGPNRNRVFDCWLGPDGRERRWSLTAG